MIDRDQIPDGVKQLLANKRFRFDVPVFNNYIIPNGTLTNDMACHALFYYALIARRAFEGNVEGYDLQYEHALTNITNFRQLFISIAFLYGVTPEQMQNYWREVDFQFRILNIPPLPDDDQYRHNKTPELKTQ